jgi:hypothetical protein
MQKSFSLFVLMFGMITVMPVFSQEDRVSNLGDVTLRFCNDATMTWWTKSLVLDTQTEKDTDICIYLNNNWPTDVQVALNFVDGTVTADADQKKACEPEDSKTNFGQYVTAQDTGLYIKAGQTLQTKASIRFPAGYAGTSYGCVTYQMLQYANSGANSNVGMFNIVSRRANFVDVHVAWEVVMKLEVVPESNDSLEILNPGNPINIYNNLVEDTLKAKTILKNVGNIGVTISGFSSYSIFWGLIVKSFPIEATKILPNQYKNLEFVLPRWMPYFAGIVELRYDLDLEAMMPQQDQKPENSKMNYQVKHIFIPWWILIVSLLIASLLWWYMKFYKQKKWNK